MRTPTVVSSDLKGPLPIQEQPPAILLPGVASAVSKPLEEMKPMAPLPPDIDPGQVAIVRHDAKKAAGERFKYVDRPLKPIDGDGRKPEVIKYDDKRSGDVIKYKVSPATPRVVAEPQKPTAEVFKYKPARIEIKS